MAFITAETRSDLIELSVAMLKQAPSAALLEELIALSVGGGSLADAADHIAKTAAFKAEYPSFQTAEQYAAEIFDNITTGGTVTADIRTAVIELATGMLTSGSVTKAGLALAIAEYLAAPAALLNTDFADIAQSFQNRADAAEYFVVTKELGGSTDAELAAAIASVTSDAATLTAANTAADATASAEAVVAGQTFTLTTGLDTVAGSTGDDTASAIISATTATTTLTAGDSFNGGEGTDTLSILIDPNMTANTMMPNLTGVENVVVRNLSVTKDGAGANIVDALSMIQASGVQNVHLDGSVSLGDLNVTTAPLAATYAVLNTPAEAATPAALKVTFNTVDVAGKADTAKFKVGGAGSKIGTADAQFAVLDVGNTSGVEAVTVATSGVNYAQIQGAGTDTKTVSITGDGTNTLVVADTAATLTLDASASTGTNVFAVTNTVTSSDVIKGGSGLDVVALKMTDATGVSFTGIEAIQITQGSDSGKVLSFAANPAAAIVVRDSDNSDVFRLANAWATDVAFEGAATSGDLKGLGAPTNDVVFGTLQLDTAHSGAADVMNVSLSNQGVNATTGYTASVKASGVETVNLVQSDIIATNTTTFALNNPGMTTFTASSDGNVSVTLNTTASSAPNYVGTASTAGTSSLKLIDFSGVAGTNSLTFGNVSKGQLASGAEIKTSVKGGSLTLGLEAATDAITVTGNVGVDNITVSGGSITANLGGGNDIISAAGQNATTVPGKLVANGDAGDDQLTGGYAADELNGGAGSDTLKGNGGADLLDGGEGSDTYQVAKGALKANGTAQVTSIVPIGMGSGETLRVTIGGQTFEQAWSTDLDTTIDAFVTAHATTIRGITGGLTGVVVAADAGTATALKFTATGLDVDANGARTSTGFTFTAPTAEIVTSGTDTKAGVIYTNARDQVLIAPNAAFDTAGESFTFKIGTSTVTVPFITSVEVSLKAFVAGNPTVGGHVLEYTADADGAGANNPKGLQLTLQSTAAVLPEVTAGTVLDAAGAAVAASATVLTDVAYTVAVTPVAGKAGTSSTASDSSYISISGIAASAMDTIQWGASDKIDYGTDLTVTAVAAGLNNPAVAATGIVTFNTTPATFQAALTAVEAGLTASGGAIADGETAIFQFGGETFVYISDADAGHDRSDTVIKLVGTPEDLVSGLTISNGDITNIG